MAPFSQRLSHVLTNVSNHWCTNALFINCVNIEQLIDLSAGDFYHFYCHLNISAYIKIIRSRVISLSGVENYPKYNYIINDGFHCIYMKSIFFLSNVIMFKYCAFFHRQLQQTMRCMHLNRTTKKKLFKLWRKHKRIWAMKNGSESTHMYFKGWSIPPRYWKQYPWDVDVQLAFLHKWYNRLCSLKRVLTSRRAEGVASFMFCNKLLFAVPCTVFSSNSTLAIFFYRICVSCC